MAQRLKLVVAYDGTSFAGWQSQIHGNTIQDRLEEAVQRITGEKVRIHGAGRTDTGVHALGQCAHLDLEMPRFTPPQLQAALNAVLPPAIRIMRCRRVARTFHARFAATAKVYRYRIWNGPVLPPFEFGRAWHITQPLDMKAMHAVCSKFKGRHDFISFTANRGKPSRDTVRTLDTARLNRRGPSLTIEFVGEGFLYKMVRMMVGAIVAGGQGKLDVREIAERLRSSSQKRPNMVAPAEGLFLIRVRY
jgi:tRNA pseudouridine38-40 synthase